MAHTPHKMVDARDLDEPLLTLASDSAPLVYAWNLADGDECTASRITDDDDQMMKYVRFEYQIRISYSGVRHMGPRRLFLEPEYGGRHMR